MFEESRKSMRPKNIAKVCCGAVMFYGSLVVAQNVTVTGPVFIGTFITAFSGLLLVGSALISEIAES